MAEISPQPPAGTNRPSPFGWAWLAFSWLLVGVPLAWGMFETVQRSLALFR